MKTTRTFMVGGTAAAILAVGWATAPRADESGTVTAAAVESTDDAGSDASTDASADAEASAEAEASATPTPSAEASEDASDDSTEESDDSDLSLDDGTTSTTEGRGGRGGGSGSSTLSEDATSAGDTDASDGTTYTGESVQTRYGSFSVQIVVVDGEVTGVSMVESGEADHESVQINSAALPQLMQEVLDTQSADVTYVSGASYTSDGFAQSVADAFAQAGL